MINFINLISYEKILESNMTHILLINTSLNQDNGHSSQLANQLAQHLSLKYQATVDKQDLSTQDLPHLTNAEMGAWMTETNERTEAQHTLAKISDTYIAQVKRADTIIIGMPMYNFGVPSTFKAWADRVARAGVTFEYTAQGPKGLLQDKKVIIVAARGGIYQGTPKDTQTHYLQDFFGFIGITDVEFLYAEGLAMPTKEESLTAAKSAIQQY